MLAVGFNKALLSGASFDALDRLHLCVRQSIAVDSVLPCGACLFSRRCAHNKLIRRIRRSINEPSYRLDRSLPGAAGPVRVVGGPSASNTSAGAACGRRRMRSRAPLLAAMRVSVPPASVCPPVTKESAPSANYSTRPPGSNRSNTGSPALRKL